MVHQGVVPQPGDEYEDEFFGWAFCGDEVPGLPPADSEEGYRLAFGMRLH